MPNSPGCTVSRCTLPSSTSAFHDSVPATSAKRAGGRGAALTMPTWRAIAAALRMIAWFSAITVTVAPLIASSPTCASPDCDLPISTLSPANRPMY